MFTNLWNFTPNFTYLGCFLSVLFSLSLVYRLGKKVWQWILKLLDSYSLAYAKSLFLIFVFPFFFFKYFICLYEKIMLVFWWLHLQYQYFIYSSFEFGDLSSFNCSFVYYNLLFVDVVVDRLTWRLCHRTLLRFIACWQVLDIYP